MAAVEAPPDVFCPPEVTYDSRFGLRLKSLVTSKRPNVDEPFLRPCDNGNQIIHLFNVVPFFPDVFHFPCLGVVSQQLQSDDSGFRRSIYFC